MAFLISHTHTHTHTQQEGRREEHKKKGEAVNAGSEHHEPRPAEDGETGGGTVADGVQEGGSKVDGNSEPPGEAESSKNDQENSEGH